VDAPHFNFEDFFIIVFFYLIPVFVLLGLFYAASGSFRSAWSKERLLLLMAPGLIYAILESTYGRQFWNLFIADFILVIGAFIVLILHIPNRLVRFGWIGLLSLSLLAVVLWWILPRANLKLF
jgi:hypothetical protein